MDKSSIPLICFCMDFKVLTWFFRFWGSSLWDPFCLYGEATPYRGVPIVDVSNIITPLTRADFYLSNPTISGEGKKARIVVPLGFKMPFSAPSGENDDDDDTCKSQNIMCPTMAEVAIVPRKIGDSSTISPYSISTDMRLSPHGSIPMDVAHVMEIYLDNNGNKHRILNLDYNGARDVGCTAPVVGGKRHAWSSAVPSVIDDDSDGSGDGDDAKRMKKAMDSVA